MPLQAPIWARKRLIKTEPTFSVAEIKEEPQTSTDQSDDEDIKIECDAKKPFIKLESDVAVVEPTILKTENIEPTRQQASLTSRPRKSDLQIAMNVYRHNIAKDPAYLSNRDMRSLGWAEMLLGRSLKSSAWKAFRRSAERFTPILNKIPEPSRNTLQLAVFDFGSTRGTYTVEMGRQIKMAFHRAVAERALKYPHLPPPSYNGTFWYEGLTIIDCRDQLSYEYAKVTVRDMRLWKKSLLRAIPSKKFQSFRAKIKLPDLGASKSDVLTLLSMQNPSIDFTTWRITDETPHENNARVYTFLIDDPPIRFLHSERLSLFFGAGRAWLFLAGLNIPGDHSIPDNGS